MSMIKRILLTIALCCSFSLAHALPSNMQAFIQHMVKQYNFNEKSLTELFEQAQFQPSIIKAMTTPYEAQPWYLYRAHFLTPDRIEGGVQYWKDHQKELQTAQKRYGVDPAIIVAIIGVETHYGTLKGHFRVIDSLSTLAFDYPKRAPFFTHELEQFLIMCREQKVSPLSINGSYAGAFGIPQFMPSSYRHFAVGYEPNRFIDLSNRHEDAILSIANYFKINKWQTNAPVAVPVKIEGSNYKRYLQKNVTLKDPLSLLEKNGIEPLSPENANTKGTLIELEGQNSPTYWVAFNNFKSIMSYNPRIAYAMAVYQLSQAIKDSMKSQ